MGPVGASLRLESGTLDLALDLALDLLPGSQLSQILVIIQVFLVKRPYEPNLTHNSSNKPESGPWLGYPVYHPPSTHPGRTTLGTPLPYRTCCQRWVRVCGRTKYGRGAQIGRSTHLRSTLVAVQQYDRGL